MKGIRKEANEGDYEERQALGGGKSVKIKEPVIDWDGIHLIYLSSSLLNLWFLFLIFFIMGPIPATTVFILA